MKISSGAIAVLVACGVAASGVSIGWELFKTREVYAESAAGHKADAPKAEAPKAAPAQQAAGLTDEKGMLAALNKKEKELRSFEEELARREERLNIIKGDIEARLAELKKVQDGIDAALRKIDEINDERIKRLVKIYESMSPEEAAPRIEKLEEELAVMLLASMSERKAAKILGFIDAGRSAKLSKSLKVKD